MRRCSRRAGDQQQKVIGIDGLREEVHGAFLHRGDRILDTAVSGHDDDRDIGVDFLRRAQHAEAVAVGQTQIRQDDRRLRLLQMLDRFGLVTRLDHGMALPLERVPEHRPQ